MKTRIFATILALCLCLLPLVSCTADGGNNGDTNPGANEKTLTKADYAAALGSVGSKCLELTSPGANARLSVFEPLAATDYVKADRLDIVRACVWFVGFLENVCKNESFELTDNYTESHIVFMSDSFKVRFKMSYAADTGRILSECYSYDENHDEIMLLDFDINYDTENKKLNDFYMDAYLGEEDFYKFYYDGASLYQLDEAAPSYASFSSSLHSAVATHGAKAWSETLVDYSKEYADACPYEMAD